MSTEEEVSQKLGVGITEHRVFLERCRRTQVASLEARLERDGNLHGLVADSKAADPESVVERAELRQRLVEVLGTLGEKERVVTTFYFYEGLKLREIGRVLTLTEGRISQILHRALAKLKEALSESPEPMPRR